MIVTINENPVSLDEFLAMNWSKDFADVAYLDVRGCTSLPALPDLPAVTYLDVKDCTSLTALPDLPAVTTLDVRGCTSLTDITLVEFKLRIGANLYIKKGVVF